MSQSISVEGAARAAMNLAGHLTTLLLRKGLLTESEFQELLELAANDEETKAVLCRAWPGRV